MLKLFYGDDPQVIYNGEYFMKSGMIRNIDELGRVVIPKEMRRKLGIGNNDPVDISVEGERIVIEKYRQCCHFCSSENNLTEFKGRMICKSCIDELVTQ